MAAVQTGELTGSLIRWYFGICCAIMQTARRACQREMSFGSCQPAQATRHFAHFTPAQVFVASVPTPTVSPILPDRCAAILSMKSLPRSSTRWLA